MHKPTKYPKNNDRSMKMQALRHTNNCWCKGQLCTKFLVTRCARQKLNVSATSCTNASVKRYHARQLPWMITHWQFSARNSYSKNMTLNVVGSVTGG